MKKILFLMVVGFGGAMLVKGGHVVVTPDNQVRVAGYNVPLPPAVQNSPVFGMITTLFMGQLGPTAQTTGAPGRPGAPGFPAMPNVTSTAGTYNANAPAAGVPRAGNPLTGASDQPTAVAKALR
jgi:hypothetical protein